MITHMRPNPANKAQVIIHFVGGHTLLVPSDRRKVLVSSNVNRGLTPTEASA
jgi:hypothetical protein